MTQNQMLQTLHDSFGEIELLKFASMFECEVFVCHLFMRANKKILINRQVGIFIQRTANRLLNPARSTERKLLDALR